MAGQREATDERREGKMPWVPGYDLQSALPAVSAILRE
jgi:hypothetical protein